MKKLLGTVLALLVCSLAAPRAHALTKEEAGEKAIGLIEGMADIIDKDKADCDKMGVDLGKFQDDNAAVIAELNKVKGERSDADKKAWKEKYGARLQAASKKMMEGGMKCEKNDKVKAAFAKMK
jgi:hypothetical protein